MIIKSRISVSFKLINLVIRNVFNVSVLYISTSQRILVAFELED